MNNFDIKNITGAIVVLASTVAMFIPTINSEVIITAYVVGSALLGISLLDHVKTFRSSIKKDDENTK